MRIVFDSHLDLAWNALCWKRDLTRSLDEVNLAEQDCDDEVHRGRATTTLPEMRRGGVLVCLGTMMARVPHGDRPSIFGASLDFPSHSIAFSFAQGQLAYYQILEEQNEIRMITTAADLGAYWKEVRELDESRWPKHPVGLILAMEGADAIVTPSQVDRWWADGLRCASLVHYGISAYAHGTGEDGPLTAAGRELLRAFERVGMILDLTHLSDTSFHEVLDRFGGPVLATHQNCRALVPGQRQFGDGQIGAIVERGGVIGVALDNWMLHPGWKRPTQDSVGSSYEEVSLSAVADHIDHLCQISGNCKHVAIGTDLDGGFGNEQTPRELRRISDLQQLADILNERDYSDHQIDSVFHGNHLRFFMENLP